MTQKSSPSKHFLLHQIENNRTTSQLSKDSRLNLTHTQNNIGINTEQIQINRDIGTNTPNYAEQIAKAMDRGNATEEIAQMLMEAEASESYWKLMTERRRQAIEETNIENHQLHNLIDDLSKENDQFRVFVSHCDYLQNILETLTTENDSLLDETSADDSPID